MKELIYIIALLVFVSCGASGKLELAFIEPKVQAKYTDNESVVVKLDASADLDSISLILNNKERITLQDKAAKIAKNQLILGENILVAQLYKEGKSILKKYLLFEVVTNHQPQKWTVKVLRKIAHETDSFTQGLSIYKGKLYETTGENGHSRLMIKNLDSGKVLAQQKIASRYFGEGSTVYKDKLYYITWTSGEGFTFDPVSLKKTGTFEYSHYSPEGWGLTAVNNQLVMSNGSDKLLFFTPEMRLDKTLSVQSYKGKHDKLNELEYDGTYIYANVWFSNEILAINPQTGRVEAIIDCSKLVAAEKNAQSNPSSDVLNGIAFNPETKTFYLTGKNWEHIYEVEIVK